MKAKIKARYLELLKETYPAIYTPTSRGTVMADAAADAALEGQINLEGVCWNKAVKEVTGLTRWNRKTLAALPA